MGDDASEIMLLNEEMQEVERVSLLAKGETMRTPKATKADIEASLIVDYENEAVILFFGSGSLTPHRDSAFLFNPNTKQITQINYTAFYNQLRMEVAHLNIEAATLVNNHFLLGIRANNSSPYNTIAVASSDIFLPVFKHKIQIKLPLNLPVGISGMDYDFKTDRLFMTFSSEDTSNALDDGQVGDSYLAMVENAAQKLLNTELSLDFMVNLTDLDAVFTAQKIEGVSLIASNRLILVADDDLGNTRIFTMSL